MTTATFLVLIWTAALFAVFGLLAAAEALFLLLSKLSRSCAHGRALY